MTELELIWAAGILEGEGNFSYRETETTKHNKRKRKLRVRLSMTDIDIVIKMRNIINPGGSFHREERSAREYKDGYKRKDSYICQVEGFKAEVIMKAILPYMGKRRSEKIQDCLFKWENNRRGPVWFPPTEAELQERSNKADEILSSIGLE